jgi:hypothetical protein
MESGGMTEDMERDVERLKDDFDEREGILKRYGETYDGEDQDEYEYSERDDVNIYTPREEEKDWKKEYDDLKARYMDRFFGTSEVKEDFNDTIEETEEDVKRDGEAQSFDELLERTEG